MMKSTNIILCTNSKDVISKFCGHWPSDAIKVFQYEPYPNKVKSNTMDVENVKSIKTKKEFSYRLQQLPKAYACISCYSNYIFQQSDINYFERPIMNFHTGKIPENRGRSPLFWDIVEEKQSSFGTLHAVSSEIDKGKILEEVSIRINSNDNPRSLSIKLLEKAFHQNIFRKWIECDLNQFEKVNSITNDGLYKKPFYPDIDFESTNYTSHYILQLWKCYQIWGSIQINKIYYSDISNKHIAEYDCIDCKDHKIIYGKKAIK